MEHLRFFTFLFFFHGLQACVDHAHWESKWGNCSKFGPGMQYHDNCVEDGADKGCPVSCGTCDQYGNSEPTSETRSVRNEDEGGFDFGTGCPAGKGVPFKVALEEGKSVTVGVIPVGKFDVYVSLEAGTFDIDIRLYDMEDKSSFSEGEAIVAWCGASGCNIGILGLESNEQTRNFTSKNGDIMEITYSGYNGVNSFVGNEFIRIRGDTKVDIRMEGYGFFTGNGTVEYSWGDSQSPCCLGTGPCGGDFSRYMSEGEVNIIGEIPADKVNLTVLLNSTVDLDIQLYDASVTSRWQRGDSIIGWCGGGPAVCNYGKLAGPTRSTVVYPSDEEFEDGLEYRWSGYNGVNGKTGNEYIKIMGATNRPLLMAAYAYTSGTAVVSYVYMEPQPGVTPEIPKKCTGKKKYYVRFSPAWTEREHQPDYPYFPRFGQTIVTSHHYAYSIFNEDGYAASPALKKLLIDDDISVLRSEQAKHTAGAIHQTVVLDAVTITESSRSEIELDSEHSLISAVSKLKPSQDWFAAANKVDFCDNGNWLADWSEPMYLYDGGLRTGDSFASRGTSENKDIQRIVPSGGSFPTSFYGNELPRFGLLSFAAV